MINSPKIFNLDAAQGKLESLVAMAFNGDLVLIAEGNDLLRIQPIAERLIPGKAWTAEDFYE